MVNVDFPELPFQASFGGQATWKTGTTSMAKAPEVWQVCSSSTPLV